MRICGMRTGVSLKLSSSDHSRLTAITTDRNSPQKHVWRAQIVLLSAEGVGTTEIMRATGKAKTCVWRWQQRFMEAGADGLLIDKTRPSRIPPLGGGVIEGVVALTLTEPPGEVTHWTAAAVAARCGISVMLRFERSKLARFDVSIEPIVAVPIACPTQLFQFRI